MDSPRYTSISRKNLMISNNKRHGSRSLNTNSQRTYRSKTPQPPAPSRPKSNTKPRKYKKKTSKTKTPRRFKYRARKDSQPEKEIEEELPDYIKATTPQPHMTNHNLYPFPSSTSLMPLQRSKSGHNLYGNNNNNMNDVPQNIPQFSPINSHSNSSNHSNYNNNNVYNTQMPLQPMSIIQSNNTTPIPMNQLPPHQDEFNTNKIRQIPKPQQQSMRRGSNSSNRPRTDSGISMGRPRGDSGVSVASINSESQFGSLLSPKQMEDQLMSHYHNRNSISEHSHTRKKTPYNDKSLPKDKEGNKKWSLSFGKGNKKRNSKSKKTPKGPKKRNSKSNSKPFNDEDDIILPNDGKRHSIEKEQIFVNKLHPEYTPLAPPKSQPPQNRSNNWNNIPQINPIATLAYNPMQSPHSYILPINNDDRIRSNSSNHSDKKISPKPYPLNNENCSLHKYINDRHRNENNIGRGRNQSKTVGNYNDHNEFMDDKEVAHKSFAFNQALTKGRTSPHSQQQMQNETDVNVEQVNREMDKMRFRCDQLDWNLSTLQTNTDKDIRQVTAKIHRVEHDMKTQNELNNRSDGHGRRNSIFNSLESSIGAVMRNVESIKDALQTLDLRMSIINQRQHDIFKHIDETTDLLENTSNIQIQQESLLLNPMDNTSTSRRASLQSMSEMLRLQSTRSMSIKTEDEHQQFMATINEKSKSSNDSNPLILPTYDDNEDILNPQSATKKKLISHIRPELLIQNNNDVGGSLISQKIIPKSAVSYKTSGDYTITIERTRTHELYEQQMQQQTQTQTKEQPNNQKLDSIVELDDDDSSTESMLSQERNTAPISVPPMDDEMNNMFHKQTSLSRRSHRRSNLDSGLSDQIMAAIKSETMVVYSSDSDTDTDDMNDNFDINDSDEKALENNNGTPGDNNGDIDEEKQYIINKENRRKKNKSRCKKSKRSSHSRSINVSMDDNAMGSTLNNIDMKTLEVSVNNTQEKRKYSESYSINFSEQHNKNQSTHTTPIGMLNRFKTNKKNMKQKTKASDIFGVGDNKKMKVPSYLQQQQILDKRRTGSMSFDIGKEPNITYEREVSVRTDDPLGLKGIANQNVGHASPLPDDENSNDDDDSMSELSVDSFSDLSADHNQQGTFMVSGDTLQQALAIQEQEDEENKQEINEQKQIVQQINNCNNKKDKKDKKKKKKKKEKQMIQLMNCSFQLHIVPNRFPIINDFIMNELSKKPSYILRICNNTTRHDLFFKTSHIYKCKSKSLRYFREERDCDYDNHINDNSIISIDSSAINDDSDDHLAPMEHMTFGDISIKKGYSYCGYFVFEAYPFPNVDINNQTPNNNNPLTPQLKTHQILSAIDEKHKTLTKAIDFTQFNELKLNVTMSPSTVNKYRRQSLSTSRRTSVVSGYEEHSVTTLLAKALDEEHNNRNDDLDDLCDIIIGYDIQLSIGDPQLNIFKCYIQFSQYSQPTYYQTKLNNIQKLKQFCNGGADGLQLTHNELQTKININYKNTIHPQIQFNIGYHKSNINIVKQPEINETLDID